MGVVRPTAPESLPLAVAAIRSSISAGVVVEDRDGNVAIANAAAQRLLGPYVATSPGWRATPGWELTDADGGALTHEALAPSLARARKEAVREQLIVVRAPSGEQAWLTLDAEPVLNEHGQLEGVDLGQQGGRVAGREGVADVGAHAGGERGEEGAEVAFPEAEVVAALDDLDEDRADQVVGEDLQQEAAALAVKRFRREAEAAHLAEAAGAGDEHALADLQGTGAIALYDAADGLVAWHQRVAHAGEGRHPAGPQQALRPGADAAPLDLDDHVVRGGRGESQAAQLKLLGGVQDDGQGVHLP